MLTKDHFAFDLPQQLIARFPLANRTDSRLMHVGIQQKTINHYRFSNIIDFLKPGDLLVCNDTKVIAARLKGHKTTGGKVEVLIERILSDINVLAQLHVSKPPKAGEILHFKQDVRLQVVNKNDRFYELKLVTQQFPTILSVIDQIGEVPLPPYLDRETQPEDYIRYQTIYAREKGSVAAPTAGLHFDQPLLDQLKQKGVKTGMLTLHVGAGTFLPVHCEDIKEHKMHAEVLKISSDLVQAIEATKQRGNRVIAVGTTSARALETAALSGKLQPFSGETNIFIYPGFNFQCIDALITNFHLPGSSLIMLVSAFAGMELIMQAYAEAIQNNYRFYSYGDAMFLSKDDF